MLKLLNKTSFRFILGFVSIILLSFVLIFLANSYGEKEYNAQSTSPVETVETMDESR